MQRENQPNQNPGAGRRAPASPAPGTARPAAQRQAPPRQPVGQPVRRQPEAPPRFSGAPPRQMPPGRPAAGSPYRQYEPRSAVRSEPPRRAGAGPARRKRPEPEREPKPPRELGGRWFRAILMVLATLTLCFFLAVFVLQSASDLFGLNQEDRQIEVAVPQNPTVQSVSVLLYDKGVVEQPFTFRIYMGLKHIKDEDILSGSYILNSNFGYDQVILALTTGDTKKEEVTVTFIEGENLYEIAEKLEENRVCKADEFLDYMQSGKLQYDFMSQVPTNPLRMRRLEGYAFPDTYEFYVGMSVDKVAQKFLDNLSSRITDDMYEKMKQMDMTLDETLALASIIQKEAGDSLEMLMVSSVFHNRLNTPETFPQLQSDVTIYYVDHFIKPFIDRANQPMYDAYNTYKCTGLPVGPICNPGLEAINAALNPEESGYYFFVTDSEGTYYYSRTLQEHNQRVAIAERVGDGEIHGTTVSDGEE